MLSGQDDVDQYKTALIKAKNEDLPALFEAVKDANEEVQRWMSAEMLPLLAMTTEFNNSINAIDNRIFNVSLYAGLTEDVVSCRGGEPASFTDKLHIMQRRLYMDEECLLNYRHGGMEFKDIEEFDRWLSLLDNLDRILPFPRCMVAMRVRREQKDRENDGKLLSSWVNFRLSKLDELTFLYIRNGQQLYRMNCDLKFDELIFPDKAMFDQSEPMMVKIFCDRVDSMITRREYEALLAEQEEKQAQGDDTYFWNRLDKYKPFDETNPYYDECIKVIADRIKYYNRIAVIVQGLFDRSETLHPHPPVKTWTNEGFEAAIELVYDGVAVLYNGEKPDFEMYRAKINESLNGNSVVVGQDYYWQTKEAEKECERLANNYRNRSDYRPKLFKPPGNEGPGYVARVDHWKPRTRKAVLSWNRERQTDGSAYSGKCAGDPIRTTITIPAEKLFNISGYTPGDYKQFFRDPRSRGDYVKWAPMLLAAEEYYAGNIRIQVPVE